VHVRVCVRVCVRKGKGPAVFAHLGTLFC
jgi:hypothetical protein